MQLAHRQSQLVLSAGYPFDIPGRNASIATYCCLAYHLPLSIAFAVREHTTFVWGGCMLLPLAALRSDRYGILAAWNQVGRHGPCMSHLL